MHRNHLLSHVTIEIRNVASVILVLSIVVVGCRLVWCVCVVLCYGQLWPENMDFKTAFWSWQSFGSNYEGGLLPPPAKTAIHFTHRIGAVITLLVLSALGIQYMRSTLTASRPGAWRVKPCSQRSPQNHVCAHLWHQARFLG